MGGLDYRLVASEQDLAGAFEVRRQVFIEEQGVPPDIELDEQDEKALHMVVKDGERVIGTARISFLAPGQAKIERMAILTPLRRQGIGRQILSFLSEELRNREVKQVVLHAQFPVIPFYQSCGFREMGSPFFEAGIKHIKMQRQL
jgi:predicted GNAT family N-acyltransferase